MNEQRKPIVLIVSLVVILAATLLIIRRLHSPSEPGRIGSQVQELLGEAAATEIARVIGGRGQIAVVVIDTSESRIQQLEQELAGFQKAIAKHGHVKIVVTKTIPSAYDLFAVKGFAMPADIYLGLLKDYPDLDGIVSFVGAPRLTEEQILELPPKRPKLVATFGVFFTGPRLKLLLEKGVAHALILDNPNPTPITDGHVPSSEEVFKIRYAVIRPETANLLPEE